MSEINILSKETFSKIAAGEVVEKPSSVVKELVENSIDAGALNISVEIENGGLDYIKIIDDGKGIMKDDLRNAFLPHATSKIKNIEDIFSIMTLGFRGEALASVASVSKILLKSKSVKEEDAMEIYIEGGEEKYLKYSPITKGTQIEVRELFYNVPARLKFLKTPQKEGSNITDVMLKQALSHPEISFTYINNGKTLLKTYGNGNQKDVIRSVYNKKTFENVSYFENKYDDYTIYGYIGNEELSRGSRNQQTLFINKRHVTSKSLTVAVEQAFKSFITVSKFPFFVLNIDLNPTFVDVNVHPQKAEVKFNDDRLMFKSVFDTIHKALREAYRDNLGFLTEDFKGPGNSSPNILNKAFDNQEGYSDINKNQSNNFSKNSSINLSGSCSYNDHNLFNYYNEKNRSTGNTGCTGRVENKYDNPNSGFRVSEERNLVDKSADETVEKEKFSEKYLVDLPLDLRPDPRNIVSDSYRTLKDKEYDNSIENENEKENENENVFSDGKVEKFPKPFIIGQFNKTYILCEIGEVLYIVDQHAAHEKINFERYMEDIKEGDIVVQPLLVPQVMELTLEDYSIYSENAEVFKKAGFHIEEFGDNTITLREVPYFLGRVNTEGYIKEILDNLKNLGEGTKEEVKYLKIATTACKASVKARDELTYKGMEILMEELRFIKDPFTCPHGRPTMIRMTLNDIEKRFRRI